MRAWYLLVDEKTDGIVAASRDPVILNRLRRGILDVRFAWSYAEYDPRTADRTGFRRNELIKLSKDAVTPLLAEKRRLARLRLPAYELWRSFILERINRDASYYDNVDALISQEIQRSSNDALSERLEAFSDTSGMSAAETYAYFSLYERERADARLQLFALAEKFSRQINECSDEGARDAVYADMRRAFTATKAS